VVDYTFSGTRVLKKGFPGSQALYTYDALGRVTDIHHKDTSSGNTLARFAYGWDDASQVTHLDKLYYDDVQNTRILTDTSDLGDQYAYDGAKRLVTVLRGVPSAEIATAMATNISNTDYDDLVVYDFDQTGNRQTRELNGSPDETYAYNTVNEMTTIGGTGQSYTDAGNWSGTSNAFKYDWENHLAETTVGATTYTWHYDALGRRVQMDDPNGDEVRFYYDGIHAI
jgi:YD repeat-containing protein